MPNDVQTNKQKLENLLNTQERIVGDLSAYDSNKQQNAAFMEQGNIESTKEEIKLIDLFMTGEYAEEDMQLNEHKGDTMDNNDFLIKRISPKKVGSYAQFLTDEDIGDLLNGKNQLFVVFSRDEAAMGAFVISLMDALEGEKGKNIFLNSAYVLEKYRRQGVFSFFLDSIMEFLSGKTISGIVTQLMIPFNEDFEPALLSCGFTRIEDGNSIYEADFKGLDKISLLSTSFPKTERSIRSFSELSSAEIDKYLREFGSRFPEGLSPQKMPGNWMKDLSFAYVTDDDIKGFILSSYLPGDVLYIGAVYMTKGYPKATAALIKRLLLDADKSGKFKKIMFAAVSEEGRKLGERLLQEAESKVKLTVLRNYYYEI